MLLFKKKKSALMHRLSHYHILNPKLLSREPLDVLTMALAVLQSRYFSYFGNFLAQSRASSPEDAASADVEIPAEG